MEQLHSNKKILTATLVSLLTSKWRKSHAVKLGRLQQGIFKRSIYWKLHGFRREKKSSLMSKKAQLTCEIECPKTATGLPKTRGKWQARILVLCIVTFSWSEESKLCCLLSLVVEYNGIKLSGIFTAFFVTDIRFSKLVKSFFIGFLLGRFCPSLFLEPISLSATHP